MDGDGWVDGGGWMDGWWVSAERVKTYIFFGESVAVFGHST